MNKLIDEFSLPVFVIEIKTSKVLYCNTTMEKLIDKDWKNLYAKDIDIFSDVIENSLLKDSGDGIASKSGWFNYIFNPSRGTDREPLNVSRKKIKFHGVPAMLYVINTEDAPKAVSSRIVRSTTKIFNAISNFSSNPETAIRDILGLIGDVFASDCIVSFINNKPFNKYFHCKNKTSEDIDLLRLTLKTNMGEFVNLYKNHQPNKIYRLTKRNSNFLFANLQDKKPTLCDMKLPKYAIPIKFPSSIKNDGLILIINARRKTEENDFASSLANMLSFFYYIISNQNQIEELSFYDNLTGFYNRNSFMRVKQNLSNTPPETVGVIFIDINGLKYTNDNYGHSFGDTVIISTSDAIKRVFNRNNVYRIGGDEFVIIIANNTREEFEEKCARFKKILLKDQCPSVSIGMSFAEGNQINLNSILESADQKMYEQKRTFYELSKKEHTIGKMHLCHIKNQIEDGIANGQFSLYVRPRFDLKGNYVNGADSIIHINRPIFNISNSFQLVRLLDSADLMYPIDCYMIKLNCLFHKRMLKKYGKSVTTSINFSNRTFLHKNFKNYLLSSVDKYGIPHRYINLQIIYLEKEISRELITTVNELYKMGFHTSINHFGVGETVFKPLQQLLLKSVKLDNSLTPALDNQKGIIALKSILKMTSDLNIDVCIDSIGSKKQVEKAIEIGFKTGRGDYYSKAVTTKKFEELFVVPYLEKLK